MQVGQRIGPFSIDKELGAGAMGAVFRARHAETGQRVAIKIIAPGLATNAVAMARFKREAAILRQLDHPNIVKLVATGKVQGTPFYAMEYVEGESLDRVMARRGRISWEEVVVMGKQLCGALCHAHQQGIVHRDLKPSNLMVLPDETVKLTDFGIAKDMDLVALTSANCTVGTAAYMSPEQCRGDRDISHKSDLYSLGVMFYELVTGKKPFHAESAMQMFLLHSQGAFERPSRLVLDIPVWLDNLICQLMEKKPDKRPFDAAAVVAALERIQEKVDAQVSAGVDAVRTRIIDRPPNRSRLDDDDKAAARELLGVKKKKKKGKPFYQLRWVQGVAFSALLAVILVVLFAALFTKQSPEELFDKADKVMRVNTGSDLDEQLAVRNEEIAYYLKYYGGNADSRTEQMRAWAVQVDRDVLERSLTSRYRDNVRVGLDEDERQFRKAIEDEDKGKLSEAREIWKKLAKYQDDPDKEKKTYGLLAVFRVEQLDKVDQREKELKDLVKRMQSKSIDKAEREKYPANAIFAMQLEEKESAKAQVKWQDLHREFEPERYNRAKRPWFLLAAKHLREVEQPPSP